MCGITGICHTDQGQPVHAPILKRMNETLTPRGPDDAGMFIEKNIGLAMRRLAIIDVAGGHQPVTNEDQTLIAVCNGEIYNFRELRADLEKKGHRFASQSDTEILPHLYEEKGEHFLDELNGMFALALWDAKNRRLLLARDRMGKKPLYYLHDPAKLIFGSELKALLAHPETERKIDPLSLQKYLAYEYLPAPRAIFQGIEKLPAAHYALWQDGKLAVKPYWDIPMVPKNGSPKTFAQAQEELLHLLRQAIRRRLISDVPLGAFLSGGIDSSAIVALMTEMLPATQVKTFSIGFMEQSYDESKHARQIAEHFGTDHREEVLQASAMLNILPEVFNFLDEPLGDDSILPTYLLSKHTRSSVTVALGGDGGDELLAGYQTFLASPWADRYQKIPAGVRRNLIEPMIRSLPAQTGYFSLDFKLKQFIRGASSPLPLRHLLWTGSFNALELARLLQQPIAPEELYSEAGRYFPPERNPQGNGELYLYQKLYLQDDILTKVDRASMACSLEVRAPFLDKEVVEFLSPLPYSWKLRGCTTKALLKGAMKKKLPSKIRNRSKQGFALPTAQWIKKDLKEKVFATLHPAKIKREGWFDPLYVQQLLQEHQQGKADHHKKLWTLLAFEWWLERWGKI